jgi:hypothetical protein
MKIVTALSMMQLKNQSGTFLTNLKLKGVHIDYAQLGMVETFTLGWIGQAHPSFGHIDETKERISKMMKGEYPNMQYALFPWAFHYVTDNNVRMTTRITRWRLLLEEYGAKYVHIAGKNNIVADALSRLDKYEDEKLSETEEGLVLSHAMCAVEKNEARVLPETKHDLVHHIVNVDEMESEEFPMSPETIAREQKKTHT